MQAGKEEIRQSFLTKNFQKKVVFEIIKGRDQWEWIGLWKVAIDWHLVRIVVMNFHFYFNLAAILE